MKKILLFALATLGVASAAQPTAPAAASVAARSAPSADTATVPVPKSAGGPAVANATPRPVDRRVEPRAFTSGPRHFHEVARLRKVKYAKAAGFGFRYDHLL